MRSLLALKLLLLGALFATTAATAAAQEGNPDSSGRVVVTLISSFDPIPDNLIPTDIRDYRVYRTQSAVFGKTIYFIRLGFFKTTADAEAVRGKVQSRFPGAFVTEITPEEFTQASGRKPPAPAPVAPAVIKEPPPAPVVAPSPPEPFAVTLLTSVGKKPFPLAPLPAELADRRLYFQDSVRDGKKVTTLNLGFFTGLPEAEQALELLRGTYPQASVRGTTAEERRQSAQRTTAYVPPKPVAATTPAPAVVAPAKPAADSGVEQRAADLMDKVRTALAGGENGQALVLLDQILKLPPNRQSQEAQELVGLAHERNKEIAEARKEYGLYLRLYPEGEGSERVRQRLANLDAPAPAPVLKAAKKRNVDVTTAYGSFSQYYYRGDTKVDTTTTVGPIIDKATLTSVDQSALLTNLDFTGRMRSGDWDNRIVVRDTYTANFLEGSENFNRLYSAYAEVRNKAFDYGGRLGRQSGNTGGLPGRFDGINVGYGFLPKWRVNLVAGTPVDFNPINSDRQFWGTSLDFGTFAEHWNGNTYYFQQTVDGITDRQAVGAELRYFSPARSLLLLTDYDVSYNELNIAMLQFTETWNSKTTLNVLVDHRRAPILETSNAVIGETNTSIRSYLLTMSEEQIRQMALDKTPISDLVMLGLNHNFNTTWQLGGDVKLYNISGTPASGSLPAQPETGNVLVYTLQGIASGLLSKRDITVLSLSYLTSDRLDGTSVGLNNRTLLQDRWTLDASLRYYSQEDSLGTTLKRLTPMLRVGYRWRQSLTFEFEYGLEKTTTVSGSTTDETSSQFYMLGYRWDF
jgi:hypothetical protein